MKTLNSILAWIVILGSGTLTYYAVRHEEWLVAIVFMIIMLVAYLIHSINKSEK
jgi:hypothetical protein